MYAPGTASAEINVREALALIALLNPKLHTVIAADPTAVAQARAVDGKAVPGPFAGQPILPQVVTPLKANATLARGAIMLSANYTDLTSALGGRGHPR